jgi:hypothetical protein
VGAATAVVGGMGMVKVAKAKGYNTNKKVVLAAVGSGLLLGGFAALLTWGIRHRG